MLIGMAIALVLPVAIGCSQPTSTPTYPTPSRYHHSHPHRDTHPYSDSHHHRSHLHRNAYPYSNSHLHHDPHPHSNANPRAYNSSNAPIAP